MEEILQIGKSVPQGSTSGSDLLIYFLYCSQSQEESKISSEQWDHQEPSFREYEHSHMMDGGWDEPTNLQG